MTEQNSPHHQEEIRHLNGIISALLFQNNALTEENAHLKVQCGLTEAVPSNHVNMVGSIVPCHSNHKEVTGTTVPHPSNPTEMIGTTVPHPSNPTKMIGMTVPRPSNHGEMIGMAVPYASNRADMIGRNESIKPLPDYIKSTGWSIVGTLPGFLRRKAGMLKVKHSGVNNMSQILLYMHNNKSGGLRELRHLTGLSEGGLAKLLMSMKRRGIIAKERFGRYVLSPGGKQLLLRWYNPQVHFSALTSSAPQVSSANIKRAA